jgi:2-keto-4-pentenoate hydratase/2-oxohepta-3-ene-1,7-dioic acid hydratase in catechol pathway
MSYQHQYVDGTRIHFPLGKVVCIGRNYAEHAKELDNPIPTEPLLFIKPGSCVVPLKVASRSRPSAVRCTTRRKSPC